jgi:hypothetical protein
LWVSWIPDLYSSCLASFLVLLFSLLLAAVFGVCSNPSVWRFQVASLFAVGCLWCILILLVVGGPMYSILLLLLAGVMMCVHTYVCGVSAVVLLTCAEVCFPFLSHRGGIVQLFGFHYAYRALPCFVLLHVCKHHNTQDKTKPPPTINNNEKTHDIAGHCTQTNSLVPKPTRVLTVQQTLILILENLDIL